jgi:hypothetical protein
MEISTFDQQDVQITAVYFRRQQGKQRLESYPRRMVYGGREYTFIEDGLRYLVQKGQELVSLFDMSDGQTQYRLRQDGQNHWSLVDMKAVA